MELYILPPEILLNILSSFSPKELANICKTSRYGHQLCGDESIWSNLTYKIYGIRQKILPHEYWYSNYMYISTSFTPQQLYILNVIKTQLPHTFNYVKNILNTVNTLVISYTQHVSSNKPSSSSVVGIDNNGHVIISTFIFPDGTMISIPKSTLNIILSLYPEDKDILEVNGILIQHKYENNNYLLYLTRHQLDIVRYM